MNNDSKWYFTSEQLLHSPSRKQGMDADTELTSRQRAANLIQDMGQRLQVSQLCINTAIVYMHRFYAFHSFTHFHRDSIAAAALFLAAKVEEQPRKLEHVIKVANISRNIEPTDPSRESYTEQAQDLVFNENVLLQTLGFDVAIDHPHTHVVKTCHLVKASKDLAQTSYFMASNSLHLTTMCLQYKPTVVACFCIHLACLWSSWEIPQSTEGKHWFHYVDKTVTKDLLKQLTDEFLHIFDKCPSRLKSKMKSIKQSVQTDDVPRKSIQGPSGASTSSSSTGMGYTQKEENPLLPSSSKSHHRTHHSSQSVSHHHSKNPANLPSISSKSSSSSKYHGQPPSIVSSNPPQMSGSSSVNNQRIKSDRSSGGGDLINSNAANIYSKDGTSSANYTSNAGSFNKNSLIPNSFNASKQSNNMPPAMSSSLSSSVSAPQKSSSSQQLQQQPAVETLSYSNSVSTSSSSSINKMRQQHPQQQQQQQQQQSQRPFPNQQSSFKNVQQQHSSKVMTTDQMLMTKQSMQQQQQQQAPPPSYGQSGVAATSYRHSQQQQQHQQQSTISNVQQQQQKSNLSIEPDLPYKFMDDIKVESSPKIGKTSSIFSPEWKEPAQQQQQQLQRGSTTTIKQTMDSNTGKGLDINNKMGRTSSSGGGSVFNQSTSQMYDRKPNLKRYNDLSTINMQQFSNIPMTDNSSLLNRLSSKRPYVPDPVSQQQQQHHQPQQQMVTQHHHHNKYEIDNGNNGAASDSRENKIRKTDYFSTTTLETTTTSNDLARNNNMLGGDVSAKTITKMPSTTDSDCDPFGKPFTSSQSSSSSLLNNSGRSIETNPDLVSTLLKESLCSDSGKYGGVSSVFGSNLDDDINKFPLKSDTTLDDIFAVGGNLLLEPSQMTASTTAGDNSNHRSKVEKKKKKDKHKHKERSKDKEERKKHKKDKDRHKERSGDGSSGMHVISNDVGHQKLPKLTIPVNFHASSGGTTGFKIKIPKDKIKSDLPPNASSRSDPNRPPITSSLKIKISKDMIERYDQNPKYD